MDLNYDTKINMKTKIGQLSFPISKINNVIYEWVVWKDTFDWKYESAVHFFQLKKIKRSSFGFMVFLKNSSSNTWNIIANLYSNAVK